MSNKFKISANTYSHISPPTSEIAIIGHPVLVNVFFVPDRFAEISIMVDAVIVSFHVEFYFEGFGHSLGAVGMCYCGQDEQ